MFDELSKRLTGVTSLLDLFDQVSTEIVKVAGWSLFDHFTTTNVTTKVFHSSGIESDEDIFVKIDYDSGESISPLSIYAAESWDNSSHSGDNLIGPYKFSEISPSACFTGFLFINGNRLVIYQKQKDAYYGCYVGSLVPFGPYSDQFFPVVLMNVGHSTTEFDSGHGKIIRAPQPSGSYQAGSDNIDVQLVDIPYLQVAHPSSWREGWLVSLPYIISNYSQLGMLSGACLSYDTEPESIASNWELNPSQGFGFMMFPLNGDSLSSETYIGFRIAEHGS
ncbi:MAG: hypothetical protein ACTSWW_10945 [Promethearchaeota archaeon]